MAWYKLDDDCEIEGLNGGGSAPPVVNYVARTDGASQTWRMSSDMYIPPTVDFMLGFDLAVGEESAQGIFYNSQTSFSNYARLFTSDSYTYNLQVGFGSDAGAFFRYSEGFNMFDGKLNRVVISRVGGVVSAYLNGVKDSVERNISDSLSFNFMSRYGGSYLSGVIANLVVEIDGVVVNEIPLTNKEQGATQTATIGTINATMLNYTPDVWEVESNANQ